MKTPYHRIKVMLATPLPFGDGVLDYLSDSPVVTGQIVLVPLGRRDVAGLVLGLVEEENRTVDVKKLKHVKFISGLPALDSKMIKFIHWVAAWTLSPIGGVLKMVLPLVDALHDPAEVLGFVTAKNIDGAVRMTATRKKILDAIADMTPNIEANMGGRTAKALAIHAGVNVSTIKAMAKAGLLETAAIEHEAMMPPRALPQDSGYSFNAEQMAAATTLQNAVSEGGFNSFVLDGVTGSGKTEVYFDAITSALKKHQQAVILLPEIALSAAIEQRFAQRFGAPPVVWHSGLTLGQRVAAFRIIAAGGARVVIGARSALFLPYPDLGLIVIDEEHEQSYKQDDHVPYHARDMAVVRAKINAIPIVLASATPSLETEANIDAGRYQRLRLTARVGAAELPAIELIDLRRTPPDRQHWIAPPLVAAIKAELAAKNQVLLFLNRRGYAPLTLCRTCGGRITCPHCSAWLVTHKYDAAMHCHHCGHRTKFPDHCPSCEAESSLVPCGPGVERLADEARRIFPDARQAVLSSDLMTTPKSLAAFTDDVTEGRVDIIIGTQMVAKGHHFPRLKLVGVVDADLGLAGGDLRAAENTWQMMVQVAGRAGRIGDKGRAMLQTVAPDTPVFKALLSGDRASFIEAEKNARKLAEMPPYGRLVSIIISGRDEGKCAESAKMLGRNKPQFDGVSILGPAPAPIPYLRGRYRFRFLIKTNRSVDVQQITRDWLKSFNFHSSIRCQVDVDPYYFM